MIFYVKSGKDELKLIFNYKIIFFVICIM